MSGPYNILDCLDLCTDCWQLVEEMIPGTYREKFDMRLCDDCNAEREKDESYPSPEGAPKP